MAIFATWSYYPEQMQTPAPQQLTIQFQDNTDCDLAKQTCTTQFTDLQVQVTLPQQPIYLKPFASTVRASGNSSAAIMIVRVHFVMLNMQMPTPVTILQATPSAVDSERSWQGNTILPVCVSGRHDWRVIIELESATTQYRVQQGLSMGGKT